MSTTGVERIEVVEGGGATLYGTGVLGGVINVITTGGAGLRARPRIALDADSLGGRSIAFENGTFAFERRVSPNRFSFPAIGPVAPGAAAERVGVERDARASAQPRAAGGDDVDHAAERAGSVERRAAAFDDFDALDARRRHRVERRKFDLLAAGRPAASRSN